MGETTGVLRESDLVNSIPETHISKAAPCPYWCVFNQLYVLCYPRTWGIRAVHGRRDVIVYVAEM